MFFSESVRSSDDELLRWDVIRNVDDALLLPDGRASRGVVGVAS